MKRRHMLKALAGGLVTTPFLTAYPARAGRRAARKGGLKKLLVVFQRGGNDSLNTLIPTGGSQNTYYHNLRPDLGIPSNQLLNVPNSGFFGLHPAMAPLAPIMAGGNLSFIHAVGYPGADRSHFESQSYFETAVPGNGLLDGWINRYLAVTAGGGAPIRGIGIGWNIPQSVQGSLAIPVSLNFGTSEVGTDGNLNNTDADAYRDKLAQLLGQTPGAGNESVYETGQSIFQMIDSFADRNLQTYAPENGAVYPTGYFGDVIRHAAQMLKDSPSYLGIECCVIDQGGYDTHAGQITPGSPGDATTGQGYLLNELAQGLAAFYTDLGSARMNDTLVLVVSEFGRRAYQNDSFGTDHGIGSLVMVMNNNVSGLAHNGDGNWPGLAPGNLVDGGDLAWVTDYRDIYWEILSRHMGASEPEINTVIPGHTWSPVNFL